MLNTTSVINQALDNMQIQNCYVPYDCYPVQPQNTFWYTYPVYITTDKTKKAIEVLRALSNDKLIEVNSVEKFIELVDKISSLL